MIQRFYVKGGASPPTCNDVCYHRYPEMSGALSYRLKAVPSVKGRRPSFIKGFGKFSLLCFQKNVFATHHQKILEFLFLFEHPFLYLPFFEDVERMVLIKGSEGGPKALNEPNVWGNSLFFVFIKRFLQPMIKIFQNFYFYLIIHFYIFLFLNMWRECHPKVFHPKVFDKGGAKPPNACWHYVIG